MATYGSNILPAFSSDWALTNSTVASGTLSSVEDGFAAYRWVCSDYHVSDTALLSVEILSGTFLIYISYLDTQSSEVFTHVALPTIDNGSITINLSSAVTNAIDVKVLCTSSTGSMSFCRLQLSSLANTSGGGGSGESISAVLNRRTFVSRYSWSDASFDTTTDIDSFYDKAHGPIISLGCSRSHEYCISMLNCGLDASIIDGSFASVDITAQVCLRLYNTGTGRNVIPINSNYFVDTPKFTSDYSVLLRLYFGDILLAEKQVTLNLFETTSFRVDTLSAQMLGLNIEDRDKQQIIPLKLCVKPDISNADDSSIPLSVQVDTLRSYITASGPLTLHEGYSTNGPTSGEWSVSRQPPHLAFEYLNNKVSTVHYTAESSTHTYVNSFEYSGKGYADAASAEVSPATNSSFLLSEYTTVAPVVVTDVTYPLPMRNAGDSAACQVETGSLYLIGLSDSQELVLMDAEGASLFDIDTGVTAFDVCQCGVWCDPMDPNGIRVFGFTVVYAKGTALYAASFPKYTESNVYTGMEITSLSQFDVLTIATNLNPVTSISLSALYNIDNAPYPSSNTPGDQIFWDYNLTSAPTFISILFGLVLTTTNNSLLEVSWGLLNFDEWCLHNNEYTVERSHGNWVLSNFKPRNEGIGSPYKSSASLLEVDSWGGYDSLSTSDTSLEYGTFLHKQFVSKPISRSSISETLYGETSAVHTQLLKYLHIVSTSVGYRGLFSNYQAPIGVFTGSGDNTRPAWNNLVRPVYGNFYITTVLDTYRMYCHRHDTHQYWTASLSTAAGGPGCYRSRCAAWPTPMQTSIIYTTLPSGTIAAMQLRTSSREVNTAGVITELYFSDAIMPQIHLDYTGEWPDGQSTEPGYATDLCWIDGYQPIAAPSAIASESSEDIVQGPIVLSFNNGIGASGKKGPATDVQFMIQRNSLGLSSSSNTAVFNKPLDWQYVTINKFDTKTLVNLGPGTIDMPGNTARVTKDSWIVEASPRSAPRPLNTVSKATSGTLNAMQYSNQVRSPLRNDFIYNGWIALN